MTAKELQERQKWSLEQKIDHALGTIDQFYQRLNGQVYISFSGGKDSTVLLWLAQKIYPNIKAVFCNTGNEYPDIVRFVRAKKNNGENIEIIYPKIKPKEVLNIYGFPLISKETSSIIHDIRINPNSVRSRRALGLIKTSYQGKIPHKWMPFLNENFEISKKCCDKLKKEPFHKYEHDTKLAPILGVMADESRQRKTDYVNRGGCNVFNTNELYKSKSLPLSIWVEQDIWDCIEKYNIPIAEIYHKGAKRTGCMFCGYGCQFKDDNRLQLVFDNYPKFYNMFMNYTNNGVTYREALRKVLAVNGLYLPDEKPTELKLFND
ncbi:MAG: phosphoadenosine phosphosulfate reductase family protein [Bacteroidales bacterium]|nr:phosphoadenosine phosphosulfate reductase family protein [Bacteroidales bacterium]